MQPQRTLLRTTAKPVISSSAMTPPAFRQSEQTWPEQRGSPDARRNRNPWTAGDRDSNGDTPSSHMEQLGYCAFRHDHLQVAFEAERPGTGSSVSGTGSLTHRHCLSPPTPVNEDSGQVVIARAPAITANFLTSRRSYRPIVPEIESNLSKQTLCLQYWAPRYYFTAFRRFWHNL